VHYRSSAAGAKALEAEAKISAPLRQRERRPHLDEGCDPLVAEAVKFLGGSTSS